jgi:hypothetical protein
MLTSRSAKSLMASQCGISADPSIGSSRRINCRLWILLQKQVPFRLILMGLWCQFLSNPHLTLHEQSARCHVQNTALFTRLDTPLLMNTMLQCCSNEMMPPDGFAVVWNLVSHQTRPPRHQRRRFWRDTKQYSFVSPLVAAMTSQSSLTLPPFSHWALSVQR